MDKCKGLCFERKIYLGDLFKEYAEDKGKLIKEEFLNTEYILSKKKTRQKVRLTVTYFPRILNSDVFVKLFLLSHCFCWIIFFFKNQ